VQSLSEIAAVKKSLPADLLAIAGASELPEAASGGPAPEQPE